MLPTRVSTPARSQWRHCGETLESVAGVTPDKSDTTGGVARDVDGDASSRDISPPAASVLSVSMDVPSDNLHFFSGGVRWRMLFSSRSFCEVVMSLTQAALCVSSSAASFATSTGAVRSICSAVIAESSSWEAEAVEGPGGGEFSSNPASERVLVAVFPSVSSRGL